jgi:hypothetical protein
MTDTPKPQLDKFKELARELEADEDEAKFEETVKKVARRGGDPAEAGPPKDHD